MYIYIYISILNLLLTDSGFRVMCWDLLQKLAPYTFPNLLQGKQLVLLIELFISSFKNL